MTAGTQSLWNLNLGATAHSKRRFMWRETERSECRAEETWALIETCLSRERAETQSQALQEREEKGGAEKEAFILKKYKTLHVRQTELARLA